MTDVIQSLFSEDIVDLIELNTGQDIKDFLDTHVYELVLAFFYTMQCCFLIVGSCIRYSVYKDVGTYSLHI